MSAVEGSAEMPLVRDGLQVVRLALEDNCPVEEVEADDTLVLELVSEQVEGSHYKNAAHLQTAEELIAVL